MPEDSAAHDILLCIQTGTLVSEPNRMRMSDGSLLSAHARRRCSASSRRFPRRSSNSAAIAERCKVDLAFKGYHLPVLPRARRNPRRTVTCALCASRACAGASANAPAEPETLGERLDYELDIIHTMGFDTYFLIVWDLCRFAREQGIWYNARGSAAGSLVAYALEITLVDPLEHGLIFERFLNPGRVSMPDIDLDFQDDQRGASARIRRATATATTRSRRSSPSARWPRAPRCATSGACWTSRCRKSTSSPS